MGTTDSRIAYDDCYAILDEACESPNGVRYLVDTYGKATHLVTRLNYARTLARRLATTVWGVGHQKAGVSAYDTLNVCRPRDAGNGRWWVYVERRETIDKSKLERL
jgi:hypothetical protein